MADSWLGEVLLVSALRSPIMQSVPLCNAIHALSLAHHPVCSVCALPSALSALPFPLCNPCTIIPSCHCLIPPFPTPTPTPVKAPLFLQPSQRPLASPLSPLFSPPLPPPPALNFATLALTLPCFVDRVVFHTTLSRLSIKGLRGYIVSA